MSCCPLLTRFSLHPRSPGQSIFPQAIMEPSTRYSLASPKRQALTNSRSRLTTLRFFSRRAPLAARRPSHPRAQLSAWQAAQAVSLLRHMLSAVPGRLRLREELLTTGYRYRIRHSPTATAQGTARSITLLPLLTAPEVQETG